MSILDIGFLIKLVYSINFNNPISTRFIISVYRAFINLALSILKRITNL